MRKKTRKPTISPEAKEFGPVVAFFGAQLYLYHLVVTDQDYRAAAKARRSLLKRLTAKQKRVANTIARGAMNILEPYV